MKQNNPLKNQPITQSLNQAIIPSQKKNIFDTSTQRTQEQQQQLEQIFEKEMRASSLEINEQTISFNEHKSTQRLPMTQMQKKEKILQLNNTEIYLQLQKQNSQLASQIVKIHCDDINILTYFCDKLMMLNKYWNSLFYKDAANKENNFFLSFVYQIEIFSTIHKIEIEEINFLFELIQMIIDKNLQQIELSKFIGLFQQKNTKNFEKNLVNFKNLITLISPKIEDLSKCFEILQELKNEQKIIEFLNSLPIQYFSMTIKIAITEDQHESIQMPVLIYNFIEKFPNCREQAYDILYQRRADFFNQFEFAKGNYQYAKKYVDLNKDNNQQIVKLFQCIKLAEDQILVLFQQLSSSIYNEVLIKIAFSLMQKFNDENKKQGYKLLYQICPQIFEDKKIALNDFQYAQIYLEINGIQITLIEEIIQSNNFNEEQKGLLFEGVNPEIFANNPTAQNSLWYKKLLFKQKLKNQKVNYELLVNDKFFWNIYQVNQDIALLIALIEILNKEALELFCSTIYNLSNEWNSKSEKKSFIEGHLKSLGPFSKKIPLNIDSVKLISNLIEQLILKNLNSHFQNYTKLFTIATNQTELIQYLMELKKKIVQINPRLQDIQECFSILKESKTAEQNIVVFIKNLNKDYFQQNIELVSGSQNEVIQLPIFILQQIKNFPKQLKTEIYEILLANNNDLFNSAEWATNDFEYASMYFNKNKPQADSLERILVNSGFKEQEQLQLFNQLPHDFIWGDEQLQSKQWFMELFLKAQSEANNSISLCLKNSVFKQIFQVNKKMAISVVSNGFQNAESLQIFCNNLWLLKAFWDTTLVEVEKVKVNFFLEFCNTIKLYQVKKHQLQQHEIELTTFLLTELCKKQFKEQQFSKLLKIFLQQAKIQQKYQISNLYTDLLDFKQSLKMMKPSLEDVIECLEMLKDQADKEEKIKEFIKGLNAEFFSQKIQVSMGKESQYVQFPLFLLNETKQFESEIKVQIYKLISKQNRSFFREFADECWEIAWSNEHDPDFDLLDILLDHIDDYSKLFEFVKMNPNSYDQWFTQIYKIFIKCISAEQVYYESLANFFEIVPENQLLLILQQLFQREKDVIIDQADGEEEQILEYQGFSLNILKILGYFKKIELIQKLNLVSNILNEKELEPDIMEKFRKQVLRLFHKHFNVNENYLQIIERFPDLVSSQLVDFINSTEFQKLSLPASDKMNILVACALECQWTHTSQNFWNIGIDMYSNVAKAKTSANNATLFKEVIQKINEYCKNSSNLNYRISQQISRYIKEKDKQVVDRLCEVFNETKDIKQVFHFIQSQAQQNIKSLQILPNGETILTSLLAQEQFLQQIGNQDFEWFLKELSLLLPGIMEKPNASQRTPLELLCIQNNFEKIFRFLRLNANFEQPFKQSTSKCPLEYLVKAYFEERLLNTGINKDLLTLLIEKYWNSQAFKVIIEEIFSNKQIKNDLIENKIRQWILEEKSAYWQTFTEQLIISERLEVLGNLQIYKKKNFLNTFGSLIHTQWNIPIYYVQHYGNMQNFYVKDNLDLFNLCENFPFEKTYSELLIQFLITDLSATKDDRLSFKAYYEQFVRHFKDYKCRDEDLLKIIRTIVKAKRENEGSFKLSYYGNCLREIGNCGFYEEQFFNSVQAIEEYLQYPVEQWEEALAKLKNRIYYTKVQGTPVTTIAKYFQSVEYQIEPELLYKIVNDYQNEILQGFGQEIAALHPLKIKSKLREAGVKKNQLKVAALIRLAMICRELTVEEKKDNQFQVNYSRIVPHHTQMITFLAVINQSNVNGKQGILAQVQTGQGKSVIIAMVAAYYSIMHGEKVDIITSNDNLAQRDWEEMKLFYERLGISSTYYSDGELTNQWDVIYCTINNIINFQSKMYQNIITGNYDPKLRRNNDCFIGDEVDAFLANPNKLILDISGKKLTEINFIWKFLYQNRDLNEKELTQKLYQNQAYQNLDPENKQYLQDKLIYYIRNCQKINIWKRDENYRINAEHKIGYFDQISNTFSFDISYIDGVTQFIQIKENLETQSEYLTFSSIFFELFIKQYSRLIGLSGTIGSSAERHEIKQLYNVNSFDVPLFEGNPVQQKLTICKKVISQTSEEWISALAEYALAGSDNGQPVLVIVEYVKHVDELAIELKKRTPLVELIQVLDGINLLEVNKLIIRRAGDVLGGKGRITLGTEFLGRGIDIQPMQQVEQNGGVKVLLGFIPPSRRQKFQMQGRTARQSNRGEFQFIVNAADFTPQFYETYLHCDGKFKVAIEKYIDFIEIEEREKRMAVRDIYGIYHQITKEFFEKLSVVQSKNRREELSVKWQFFFTRWRWDAKNKEKGKVIRDEFMLFLQKIL